MPRPIRARILGVVALGVLSIACGTSDAVETGSTDATTATDLPSPTLSVDDVEPCSLLRPEELSPFLQEARDGRPNASARTNNCEWYETAEGRFNFVSLLVVDPSDAWLTGDAEGDLDMTVQERIVRGSTPVRIAITKPGETHPPFVFMTEMDVRGVTIIFNQPLTSLAADEEGIGFAVKLMELIAERAHQIETET